MSTAYVAGEPGGLFREDELSVGQSFRNPYERSKFEAEVALRSEGGDQRDDADADRERPDRPEPVLEHPLLQEPRRQVPGERPASDRG